LKGCGAPARFFVAAGCGCTGRFVAAVGGGACAVRFPAVAARKPLPMVRVCPPLFAVGRFPALSVGSILPLAAEGAVGLDGGAPRTEIPLVSILHVTCGATT
jgi:hypothetical protein